MYLCFQTTVISEPSFETEAREKITSKKYMLRPQLRLQLQSKAMKPLSSVTANHQNQVPLDTVYQCAKLGQEGVVEEKNSI